MDESFPSSLNDQVSEAIVTMGGSLVGIASLSGFSPTATGHMMFGISIATALRPHVVLGLSEGPTAEYDLECKRVNQLLDALALWTASYLRDAGHRAVVIRASVPSHEPYRSHLHHKKIAVAAGLGWIGKSSLLITREYGSALRLSTVLTDANLITNAPYGGANCGDCRSCLDGCPAGSITDPYECRNNATQMCTALGIDNRRCGKCIFICPWTQRYVSDGHMP